MSATNVVSCIFFRKMHKNVQINKKNRYTIQKTGPTFGRQIFREGKIISTSIEYICEHST